MSKYYFCDLDDDGCFPLEHWRELMKENGVDKTILYEAKRETNCGYFFCREYQEITEKDGMTCGKRHCKDYSPRNGKSGICKHNFRYTIPKFDSC